MSEKNIRFAPLQSKTPAPILRRKTPYHRISKQELEKSTFLHNSFTQKHSSSADVKHSKTLRNHHERKIYNFFTCLHIDSDDLQHVSR